MDRFPDELDAVTPPPEHLARVAGLFGFARGLLQASGKTLHRMRSTELGCFDQASLSGLAGLTLDDEGGTWLRLARVHLEAAPHPPSSIAEWLPDFNRATVLPPLAEPVLLRDVSIEFASDLCEGGLLVVEDIHDREPGEEQVRIVLRLDRLDELRAEIRAWIDGEWAHWAERQRPVLRSVAVYDRLFQLYNRMHGGAETAPELVWGTGVATWRPAGFDIEMPLIEQLVDLTLEDDGTLAVMPRRVLPAVNLAPFHEADAAAGKRARTKLDTALATLIDGNGGTLSPFRPETVEPLLLQAASLLAVDGRCITRSTLETDGPAEDPGRRLQIVSSWVLYARPRTTGARADDLQRLGAAVSGVSPGEGMPADIGSVPAGLLGLVRELSSVVPDTPSAPTSVAGEGAPGGWGATAAVGAGSAHTEGRTDSIGYFFPLAHNEEQGRIIDALEMSPVVTVTGPPGTGKTHTIANIISHYMATGRRVLVTARTAEAIAAVREKLPAELATLVISSVGSDQEGTRQLEDAIERLSDEVVSLDETSVRESVERLTSSIRALDAERRELDASLARIAAENLAPFEWQGANRSAMEVASLLRKGAERHAWFEDRPSGPPPTTFDRIVDELRELLPRLADDLPYRCVELPAVESIPDSAELLALHRLAIERGAMPAEDTSDRPTMARDTHDADERAAELLRILENARDRFASSTPWVHAAIEQEIAAMFAGRTGSGALTPVLAACRQLGTLAPGELQFDPRGLDTRALDAAIARACAGGKPLSMVQQLRDRDLARALNELRMDGSPPQGREDWARVRDTLRVEAMRPDLVAAWSDASRGLPLHGLPQSPQAMVEAIRDCAGWHAKIHRAAGMVSGWAERLEALFPLELDVRACLASTDFDTLARALRANLGTAPVGAEALDRLVALAEAGSLGLHRAFRELHGLIGDSVASEQDIVERRGALTREIRRLHDRRSEFDRAAALFAALREGGAPAWSVALEADPLHASALLPEHWRESWSRACVQARLDRLDELGNGDELLTRKRALSAQRETLLRELIRARTLMGLRPRMSESVRSALMAFTNAVRRHGRGTGAQAGRWRAEMFRSASVAAQAAPVWVMPEYKIAEQLPSNLASFDLVVLDEASQCDITSISSLARGTRCLIVGDEKQVSPSSVGIPLQRIDVLRAEFLAELPSRNRIDQDTSIFDLACQAYPESHLMLREHFRCVEPIIRFSTRYYQDRLIPLRVPRASERFDPPLVDMQIAGAARDGVVNRAEIDVIVDEIAMLAHDPAHAERGIAVISLIGSKQAEAIEKRLIGDERIGPTVMKRHRIICGDARTLQGQERSIVFLSMVAVASERGSVRAQSNQDIQQRMNVAMSRACDRLYLARSVTLDQLKPGDIKRDVLLHFQDPMPDGGQAAHADMLELCDSGFERDVCSELVNAGYRVRPQVKAGPFRIDLVVEGADDRRLAIELDGDRWHGPEVWERDMRRQASLERAGWTFWRVFGSQWVANRAHHWNDLVDTLGRSGIEPIGAARTGETFSELRKFVVEGDAVRELLDERPDTEESPSAREIEPAVDEIEPAVDESESVLPDIVPDEPPADGGEGGTGRSVPDTVLTDAGSRDESADRSGNTEGDDSATPEPSFVEPEGVATDFHSEEYRPALARRACALVDEHGPIDIGVLYRLVSVDHGFGRTGRRIRETVRAAVVTRRVITESRRGGFETVWPQDADPVARVVWTEAMSASRPDWDELCWPERVGLLTYVLERGPDDVHRGVLEHVAKRSLTERLKKELDRAAGAARTIGITEMPSTDNDGAGGRAED